jgi:ABC-2 type transport system permease protein
VLLRFGQLTPAFVLQVLAPLVIVFLAFGSVARERERGQLRLQLTQGVAAATLLAGKLSAHGAIALLLAAPALLALVAIAVFHPEVAAQALTMLAAYALYLLMWAGAAILVSSSLGRARDALLALVGAWIVTAILVPRLMPDLAVNGMRQPTRIETEAAIHARLAAFGDSHDPDDPYFSRFRAKVLARYGVSRIEDLPVNYGGLVMAEGERLTSELFAEFMRADYERQAAQSGIVYRAAVLSPVIALRRMSTALAGTNLDSHARFLLEGEKYRYGFVQALNGLHATRVSFHNDRDQRISRSHWQETARFGYPPDTYGRVAARHVWPAFAVLAAWLVLLGALARLLAKRLERNPK